MNTKKNLTTKDIERLENTSFATAFAGQAVQDGLQYEDSTPTITAATAVATVIIGTVQISLEICPTQGDDCDEPPAGDISNGTCITVNSHDCDSNQGTCISMDGGDCISVQGQCDSYQGLCGSDGGICVSGGESCAEVSEGCCSVCDLAELGKGDGIVLGRSADVGTVDLLDVARRA